MSDTSADTEPFRFTAPLSVCVDVRDPQAYLALQPVRTLAQALTVTIDWLPFPTAPAKPPPQPADDRGTRHRRMRARYREMDLERYAAAQAITLGDPYRTEESTPALVGLLWLREHAPRRAADYLQRVFAGFWAGDLDIEDLEALGRIMTGLGEDGAAFAAFAAGPGPAALAAFRSGLVAAGVFAVPSLVVDGEVFVGRAHLPMVRWRLTGSSGPPPI